MIRNLTVASVSFVHSMNAMFERNCLLVFRRLASSLNQPSEELVFQDLGMCFVVCWQICGTPLVVCKHCGLAVNLGNIVCTVPCVSPKNSAHACYFHFANHLGSTC